MCNMCSLKMDANINLLQEEVFKLADPDQEDLIMLSIAGLKRVSQLGFFVHTKNYSHLI